MKILAKVKKLSVVVLYVPAALFFFFALSFWRTGDTESAFIYGLLGIGFVLLGALLQTIRRFIGNERRFEIFTIIMVFCCSLYMWIYGDVYDGLISTAIWLFMIANHFFYSQKGTGSRWSTPMWQIYIPIVAGLITFGSLFYLQYKSRDQTEVEARTAGVQQGAAEDALESNGGPDNESKNKVLKPNLLDR